MLDNVSISKNASTKEHTMKSIEWGSHFTVRKGSLGDLAVCEVQKYKEQLHQKRKFSTSNQDDVIYTSMILVLRQRKTFDFPTIQVGLIGSSETWVIYSETFGLHGSMCDSAMYDSVAYLAKQCLSNITNFCLSIKYA